mmetsp:Transcript_57243/g.94140  ORF Transcript_57243/g.94140 Transcript_57243/m.94140 type:complete len:206 (-) Transcript_57243:983-1600(-)
MLLDANEPLLMQTRLNSLTLPICPWPEISGNDATEPPATTTPAHPLQNAVNRARVMTSHENSSATSPTPPPRTPRTKLRSSNARLLTPIDALLSCGEQNLPPALAQTTSLAPWISMPGGVSRMLCEHPKKTTPSSWSPTPRQSPSTPTKNPWSNRSTVTSSTSTLRTCPRMPWTIPLPMSMNVTGCSVTKPALRVRCQRCPTCLV